MLALALLASGCGSPAPSPGAAGSPSSGTPASGTSSAATGAAAASPPASPGPAAGGSATPRLDARLLPLHLGSGLSRAVVVASGQTILVMGGLGPRGTSAGIERLDPAAGVVTTIGRLASPVHDAAGASLGNRWVVAGGGEAIASTVVQAVTADGASATAVRDGSLPAARADGAAVTARGQVVVVGGGRGGVPDPAVLATRDGVRFRVLGRLPVPVRYSAVVAVGGAVYVLGGETGSGDTDAIQRIDLATGTIGVVGRLPGPLSQAAAWVLDGRVLVAGGMRAGVASRTILAYNPVSGRVTTVGRLPIAVADAGAVVIGATAYLVGGETGSRYLDSVIAIG